MLKLSSIQLLSRVQLFATPWTAAHQAPLSSTFSLSLLKLMSSEPTISFSVSPFSSCPQSFPASGSFPMSRLFTSSGQSIGVSASVLPMNIQGWFPLGLTGLISLLSKGLPRVFSTTVQKHQVFDSLNSFLRNECNAWDILYVPPSISWHLLPSLVSFPDLHVSWLT